MRSDLVFGAYSHTPKPVSALPAGGERSPQTSHTKNSAAGNDEPTCLSRSITAAVRLAQRLGLDVVVIDHHRIQESFSPSLAPQKV
jgi:hypothetical protein